MSWNDERVEKLKKLWAAGYSASVIARDLGGFGHTADQGRSAVIGKVHRLGLSGRVKPQQSSVARPRSRPTPEQRAERARQQTVNRIKRQPQLSAEPLPPPDAPAPLYQRKTLLELEAHHCRWPIGDPREPEFHFCGATKVISSYCEVHARQALAPKQHKAEQGLEIAARFVAAGLNVRLLDKNVA